MLSLTGGVQQRPMLHATCMRSIACENFAKPLQYDTDEVPEQSVITMARAAGAFGSSCAPES